jgi:hypothetical protein
MDWVNVCDDVAVCVLLEEKGPEVRLTAFHHLLDGSDYRWVADDDSLVETRKEGSAGDGES